ncbi:hypothetical protein ACFLYG_01015 [Chloroflexota bacterium]
MRHCERSEAVSETGMEYRAGLLRASPLAMTERNHVLKQSRFMLLFSIHLTPIRSYNWGAGRLKLRRSIEMRTDALMNGGLIGFGLGFIAASIGLLWVVRDIMPEYATLWHFRGVIIIGAIGLAAGIGMEVFQRVRMKRSDEMEE